MGFHSQNAPPSLGHGLIHEPHTAVNERDSLKNLLLAIVLKEQEDPKVKQEAIQIIKMLLSSVGSGDNFREILGGQILAPERLLGLSPVNNKSFLDLMSKESKEGETLNDPIDKAVVWELKPGRTEPTEAVIGDHPRAVVSSEEMDGNVRANVKLVSEFPGGKIVSGSGTVIGKWVILTAGHNCFDRMLNNSPAESITAIAGTNGPSVDIEIRQGSYAILPFQWYTNCVTKQDMALILLDRPFKTATPVKIRQTPTSEKGTVYGYSSDPPYYNMVLCKSDSVTKYDQNKTAGMVDHYADTFKGTSGGGVVGDDGILFAIHRGHVKMNDGTLINRAVAVDREGNDIAPFVTALYHMAKHDRKDDSVSGEVDFTVKEGAGVEVKMTKEVNEANGFRGFAYTW